MRAVQPGPSGAMGVLCPVTFLPRATLSVQVDKDGTVRGLHTDQLT